MSAVPQHRAVRLARGIRDAWLIAGIALLLFTGLEVAYVTQRVVRASLFGSDSAREAQVDGHPYAGQDWYREFVHARDQVKERFDPWRTYWAYQTTSTYLNIDANGVRVTTPVAPPSEASRVVFLLGGSAMWGFTSRDEMTIPSLVSAKLRSAGIDDLAVVNLAQPGYTFTHEVATLTNEVAHGAAPSLAVFYNGINDIRTAHLYREPGHVFFEPRLRHLYEVESQRGLVGSLVTPTERSRLVSRLKIFFGLDRSWAIPPRTPEVCPALGQYYRRLGRVARGVADAAGFEVLFVQQPQHASTGKVLTTFERSFMGSPEHVQYTRECSEAIDRAMAAADYLSYGSVFDADTGTVFLDEYGHTTESGNALVASKLADEIATRLTY